MTHQKTEHIMQGIEQMAGATANPDLRSAVSLLIASNEVTHGSACAGLSKHPCLKEGATTGSRSSSLRLPAAPHDMKGLHIRLQSASVVTFPKQTSQPDVSTDAPTLQ